MKKIIVLLLVCAALCGCHTSKTSMQVVSHSVHDTIFMNKMQYDSIYHNDSFIMDYHPSKEYVYLLDSILMLKVDTMYIHDRKVEFKYKYLHDTIYVHQIDSVPIIKTVEVTTTGRYVPTIYKWSLGIIITLVIILIIYIVWKIKF